MGRRVYYTTPRRQRLVTEALQAVRETRLAIDPALLERVRAAIGRACDRQEKQDMKPMHIERVPVDRKKNLAIVLKFLELQPGNKALQQEIQSFLSQH